MAQMVCDNCGLYGIEWYDLTESPYTKCPHCGGRNCQRPPKPEPEPIEDDHEEEA
jgi:DNA-directed RNA polymerase subunit RPC12/RpoP